MDAIARAQQRIEDAAAGRTDPAAFDATLERARHAVEALAATTARFEAGLPEAVQDGLRQHFRPSARHLAEVRGLTNQVIRRLELQSEPGRGSRFVLVLPTRVSQPAA